MTERKLSWRQQIKPSENGLCRLGIFVNTTSNKLFYGSDYGAEEVTNRIRAEHAYVDDDGYVCVRIERRVQDGE